MAIENDEELREAATKAGQLVQEIHDYCVSKGKTIDDYPDARIRFPRGFIRTANYQRERFPFIDCTELKSNIAYTLILSDTIIWLILRTDLSGISRDMLHKLFIFLVASVVESTTKEYLKTICGKNYKTRTAYLKKHGIISEDLRRELDWLWDTRNRMHLFQLEKREYENEYNPENHIRCIKAFRGLLKALRAKGKVRTR
ncbi:hypothetical protein Q2E61_06835 [Microbulbifer thermotolerans]|uniref:hypothetical protein n=1 Tax=Microbulbifer thermotolerans TaxID=252514 RepID=UPI0026726DFD|nr:hypothetical protein [Microbulbifer thermotolerans]WKT61906.1 hypothetical protein Q2E61_06835 [Microbulbifer thermotolerans]